MDETIGDACGATIAFADALSSIYGTKVGASAFPGRCAPVIRMLEPGQSPRRMKGNFGLQSYGTTPLAEALVNVELEILATRTTRKIILVVTDGLPDDANAVKQKLLELNQSGIETMAITLGCERLKGFCIDLGFEPVIHAATIEDLPKSLFQAGSCLL
jgi:Mg-chelatase subunit ChlD